MSLNYQFHNATPPSLNHTRVPVANGANHRREGVNEPRALFTREPLPDFEQREKKLTSQQPRRRRKKVPDTSPFTYHPREIRVPLGKQDPPLSRSFSSEGTAPSNSMMCRDEGVAATSGSVLSNRPFDQQDGLDACRKRPRVLVSEPAVPYYPYSPDTDPNSAATDHRDSPVSYTSSSSNSDQSHTRAAEISVLDLIPPLPSPETCAHYLDSTFGCPQCGSYIDPRHQYEAQCCQPGYNISYIANPSLWPHSHQD